MLKHSSSTVPHIKMHCQDQCHQTCTHRWQCLLPSVIISLLMKSDKRSNQQNSVNIYKFTIPDFQPDYSKHSRKELLEKNPACTRIHLSVNTSFPYCLSWDLDPPPPLSATKLLQFSLPLRKLSCVHGGSTGKKRNGGRSESCQIQL